jgi:hypothetical protein
MVRNTDHNLRCHPSRNHNCNLIMSLGPGPDSSIFVTVRIRVRYLSYSLSQPKSPKLYHILFISSVVHHNAIAPTTCTKRIVSRRIPSCSCIREIQSGQTTWFRHIWQVTVKCLTSLSYLTQLLGSVYLGKDVKKGKEVALKVERHEGFQSDLFREYNIYKDVAGCTGISRVYWYGQEGPCNVMVIDRYELSLDDMVRQGAVDLHTIVSFAGQMVSTCPNIHLIYLQIWYSCIPWNPFMVMAISIVTSSLIILWLELTRGYISSTSD